jgi:hypothetical protein
MRWLSMLVVALAGAGCGDDDASATPRADAGPRPDGGDEAVYANVVLEDDPVGYWRFGESGGTTAIDEVGQAHPGTYHGGFTLGVAGIAGSDGALGLDGASGCVVIGDAFRFAGRVPFSVEAWVKLEAYGEGGTRLVSSEGFPTGIRSGWSLSASYADSGYPYFDAWNSDGEPSVWTMGAYASVSPEHGVVPLGEWAHVVGTYADDREELWVNGIKRDSQDQTGGAIPDAQGTLTIGCAGDGVGLPIYLGVHGAIDEVAIYDRVLGDAEIIEHHQVGAGL